MTETINIPAEYKRDEIPWGEEQDFVDEYAPLRDPDSFAVFEDGEVHAGINQENILADIDNNEKKIEEDDILEYIDPKGRLLSWNMINKAADARNYPVVSYMIAEGIVHVDELQEKDKPINDLDYFFEDMTDVDSFYLLDMINIASLIQQPTMGGHEANFDEVAKKLIRAKMARNQLTITKGQEQSILKSFKNVLFGPANKKHRSYYLAKLSK